jgi:hypothetical protein
VRILPESVPYPLGDFCDGVFNLMRTLYNLASRFRDRRVPSATVISVRPLFPCFSQSFSGYRLMKTKLALSALALALALSAGCAKKEEAPAAPAAAEAPAAAPAEAAPAAEAAAPAAEAAAAPAAEAAPAAK